MKTLFLPVLISLFARPGWAQVKVLMIRDTAQFNVSPTQLAQIYPPALDRVSARQGVASRQQGAFSGRSKVFLDSINARSQRFYLYTEANKRRLPLRGVAVQTDEFIRPDGSYAWVFCRFFPTISERKGTITIGRPTVELVLTPTQQDSLLRIVADWYQQHPFPLPTTAGFRWDGFAQLGSIPQPRKARTGPGIISTLEAAQKTERPDTVTTLAFNQLDLLTVPDVVYRFPKLEELDLSKNGLHELPARVTEIPTLKRLSLLQNSIPNDSVFITPNKHLLALNLQGNRLTRVPQSVRQNRRLESLWLGNNKLTELDVRTLRRLRRLDDLNLYNAGLTTLPKQIGRMKRLKVLDLYYNKFTELPRQVGRMKRLEQLAVAYNDLSQLPASLAKLRRLQVLFAHHNRISQLPTEFERLRNLRVLDLGYNWFTVPPAVLASLPALEELDLSNNNVQELPPSLGGLKGLKKLYLRSNPLTRTDAKAGPYAPVLNQLEANNTEVFY